MVRVMDQVLGFRGSEEVEKAEQKMELVRRGYGGQLDRCLQEREGAVVERR